LEEFLKDQFKQYLKDSDEYFLPELTFLKECSKQNLSFINGCDELGIALAKLYYARKIDYLFGDIIANDVSAYMISFVHRNENLWAHKFWEVYEAFDAGEYYRTEDKKDDPIKEHTDPMISDFLEHLE